MPKTGLRLQFSGGVDTESGPYEVADGDFPDVKNFLTVGNFLQKRGGTRRYNAQCLHAESGIIGGIRAYDAGGSSKKTIVVAPGGIYKGTDPTASVTGSFTNLATLSATPTYVFFEQFVNSSGASIVVICAPDGNTFSNTPRKYSIAADTSAALGGSPANAWFPVEFQRYLFLFNAYTGGTHYPNRGYFSARDNGESWSLSTDFIRTPYAGGAITGVKKIGDIMFVFTERAVYSVTGTTFSATAGVGNQSVSDALATRGCIAPKTLVSTGDYMIFLSEDGVRTLDQGGNSAIISGSIRSIIQRISKTSPFCTAAGHYDIEGNRYLLAYNDSLSDYPTGNFFVLSCDLDSLKWHPLQYRFPINAFFDWPSFGDDRRIYACGADGFVYQIETVEPSDARREKKIADFETDETWAEGPNGTGSTAADATNFREGAQGRRLTAPASTSAEEVQFSFPSTGVNLKKFDDDSDSGEDDFIQIKVFCNAIANVTSVTLFFSSVAASAPATAVGISYVIPAADLATGWTTVNIKRSAFTASAGHDFGNIQFMTIRYTPVDSDADYVTVDDLRLVANRKSAIVSSVAQKRIGLDDPTFQKGFVGAHLTADFFPHTEVIHESYVDGRPAENTVISAKEDHLYIADATTIRKVYRTDPDYLVSSYSTGITALRAICADDDYVYVLDRVSGSDVTLRKLTKALASPTTLSLGAEDGGAAGLGWPMTVDDKYIFLAKGAVDSIIVVDKVNLTNLRTVTITGAATNSLGHVFADDGSVYVSYCATGTVDITIAKFKKSDFINGVLTTEDSITFQVANDGSPTASGTAIGLSVTADAENVFFGYQDTVGGVFIVRLSKHDFSRYVKINAPNAGEFQMCLDETFVYILDYANEELHRVVKDTMETFDTLVFSSSFLSGPLSISLNDPSQYVNHRKAVVFPINSNGNWCQSVIRNDQPGQAMNIYAETITVEADEKMN